MNFALSPGASAYRASHSAHRWTHFLCNAFALWASAGRMLVKD